MNGPLVYEINTRCWLRELTRQAGHTITLATVPDAEIARWAELGFTHVWAMGVWETGPKARAAAWDNAQLRRACREVLPDFSPDDFAGSPYAVAAYRVARGLGGETGLQRFRRQLRGHGLKLLLDFVPNHTGLDHVWLVEAPDRYVQAAEAAPGVFAQETSLGPRWIAHGRDPNFAPWCDTAQLDYRRPPVRAALIAELKGLAKRCDGVRCDMAMLVLNEVFRHTWEAFPVPEEPPVAEFWAEAIAAVRADRPGFLFLAEVYWGLEAKLQALGFDYTYDKLLYDRLLARESAAVHDHVLARPEETGRRCAHFLENHDERRIAALLSPTEHRRALLLVLGLPGLRLIHEGQLEGACLLTPVQLGRRPVEPLQADLQAMYLEILGAVAQSSVGRGEGRVLAPQPSWYDNPTHRNFVLVQWRTKGPEFDLVVVNLAPHRSQCYAPITFPDLAEFNWALRDLLGTEQYERYGDDLASQGLYLDVTGHAAQLFHFRPL